MIDWKYNPEDYGKIKPITPGQYRVRIDDAEEQVSKKGYDMIKMTLKVSGYNQKVFEYLAFPPKEAPTNNAEREKYDNWVQSTNNKLGQIFDSFGIEPGNLNVLDWKGKVGAAEIKNEVDNQGNMQNRINFFIKRDKQASLPAWQENPVRQAKVNTEMVDPDGNDCPF